MSQNLGRVVLQRVSDHYEAHPSSWCTGEGTLKKAYMHSPGIVEHRIRNPQETGCMDTLIRCQARIVAGDEWKRAARQATRMLCRYHGLWFGWYSITNYNDERCKSAQEAVDFIDKALGSPAKPVRMPEEELCSHEST